MTVPADSELVLEDTDISLGIGRKKNEEMGVSLGAGVPRRVLEGRFVTAPCLQIGPKKKPVSCLESAEADEF